MNTPFFDICFYQKKKKKKCVAKTWKTRHQHQSASFFLIIVQWYVFLPFVFADNIDKTKYFYTLN